jgi:hypothetical protein
MELSRLLSKLGRAMMDKASLGNLDGVFCLPDVSS